MLFSATQTRKTEDLARISLKKEPIYIGVHDSREVATVEGLQQVSVLALTKWGNTNIRCSVQHSQVLASRFDCNP